MPTLAEGAGPRSLETENEEKKRILKSDANSPELLAASAPIFAITY